MNEECGKCKVKIKRSEQSLACFGCCGKYFHLKYQDLSNEKYSIINKSKSIKWFCDICTLKFEAMAVVNNDMEQLKRKNR